MVRLLLPARAGLRAKPNVTTPATAARPAKAAEGAAVPRDGPTGDGCHPE